jgi:hypothetical protein
MLLASPVMADSGFYLGAGFGGARVELDMIENGLMPEETFPPLSDTIDGSNFGASSFTFKGFAGYKFFDYFALEVGYVDLGEAKDTFCFLNSDGECAPEDGFLPQTVLNPSNPWAVTAEIQGWTIEAVGILPIAERWDLFAKLGVFSWDSTVTALDEVVQSPERPSPLPPVFGIEQPNQTPIVQKTSGDELTFGVGGNFDATGHISIRAEFQWFDIPYADTVWTATMSGYYRF